MATVVLVAAWGLRWLWGPQLPPGVDVTGHLTRLEVGFDLFASGRLDGWFDRAMLGYQTFLMYGPGLAIAAALARVLSFGVISTAGAYEVIGIAGFVALPFAGAALARGFGLSADAARAAGLMTLAVSSGRGGGIQGAFDIGLMPNHLAAPLVLFAWALMLRDRQRPIVLGFVVAAVAVTHPQSLIIFVGFAPFVLLAGWACGSIDRERWAHLGVAGLVSLLVSAWWWYPAVAHRDLRGILTSWDLPTFWDHLGLIYHGERGWIGWSAVLVMLAWAGAVAAGAWTRHRRALALAALPVAALASLHLAQWALVDRFYEVILFPNRGFSYAAYLCVPVVGLALGAFTSRWPPAAWLIAGVVVVVSIGGLVPPASVLDEPVDGMWAAADTLSQIVDDGDRFAYVESDVDQIGVPAPGRWLGWASGRTNLGPFGTEYAPGAGLTTLVFDPPGVSSVDEWVERVARLGVTHLVAGDPETAAVLAVDSDLRLVAEHDPVTVWEIEGTHPFKVVEHERERMVLEVGGTDDDGGIELPVGYSPGWTASVDGVPRPLERSDDGRLTIVLAPGEERIELTWTLPGAHLFGRIVTLATLALLAGLALWRKRPMGGELRAIRRERHPRIDEPTESAERRRDSRS